MPLGGLPENIIVTSTLMFPPVERLYHVLLCARQRLSRLQLEQYIQRLSNPIKHHDVVAEMLPALRLDSNVEADFEVVGQWQGNHTLDWWIRLVVGLQSSLM